MLVLQSARIPPYEYAFRGFQRMCDCQIRRAVLSELADKDIRKLIEANTPVLIAAIGRDALIHLKNMTDIPILYFMVQNTENAISETQKISGISMTVRHDIQLKILLKIIPDMKTVGILYDPDRSAAFVEKSREAADENGVRLLPAAVYNSKYVPSTLNKFKHEIDALWMIPDVTVITPETLEFFLLFSLENKIPILTFSEKYLKLGTFVSISIDPEAVGEQAGEMAVRIMEGELRAEGQYADARKAKVRINHKLAKKLGISVAAKILREVGSDG